MIGRPKGGKNNYHSKEEKLKIVKEMLEFNLSPLDIEKNIVFLILWLENGEKIIWKKEKIL